ncbi:hypothetical protein GCM10023168_03410 [Fodinibacter luteus]|uniref:HNH endonuclease n=1 Tax=Fodinibacter luteus TaxID=552064 RepID=A0ABP8JYL4_9MICO
MERKLRKQAKRQAARRAMLDGTSANRQDPRRRPTRQGPTTEPKVERRLPRAPGGTVAFGWCGSTVTVPHRGRIPKWCSATCRHRAWEQRRAAASGRAAIEVVDRPVEVVHHVNREKSGPGGGYDLCSHCGREKKSYEGGNPSFKGPLIG